MCEEHHMKGNQSQKLHISPAVSNISLREKKLNDESYGSTTAQAVHRETKG